MARRLKTLGFKLGLHHVIRSYPLQFLGNFGQLSRWMKDHQDLSYSEKPSLPFDSKRRFDLHQYLIEHHIGSDAIDYLEFGVAEGVSFRWWVDKIKNPDSRFYGFDTFTGLPEDWGTFKAGDMSNGNEPPQIDDGRVSFYQGIFQQTLFDFLKAFPNDKRKVIHLDADLYTATLFVLTSMSPYLKSGDIIMFDEFNVAMHEFKAFNEWSQSFYIDYKVLGQVNNYYQIAIMIK